MEFQEVMRQWKRMCTQYTRCIECPMNSTQKCIIPMKNEWEMDFDVACEIIMSWAKEHPEPVYPTWWKYMCMIGVIPDELGDKTLGEMTVYNLMNTCIQSDIAQRLGIEPKHE